MGILFNRIERPKPGDPQAPRKWYAVLRKLKQIGEKEVAKLISDETTLNPKEAEMAIEQLKKVLILLFLNGNSVQLGDWGSFHLTCNSKGKETREAVTAADIEKLNIRFVAGDELKEALKKAQFILAESIVNQK
jgi:predicted histone-like DNA-binding protein